MLFFFCLFCFCKETLRRPQSRHLEVKERLALVFIQHTFIQNRMSHLLYILLWKEKYNHQRCEENLCFTQTGTLCWWNAHCKTKTCSFTDRIRTEALKVSFLILISFIFPPVFIFLSWLFSFSVCENYRFLMFFLRLKLSNSIYFCNIMDIIMYLLKTWGRFSGEMFSSHQK